MFNAVTKKLLTILFLGALLALALQLIHGIVVERPSRQQEVEAGVAAGLGGRQTASSACSWPLPSPNRADCAVVPNCGSTGAPCR